MTLRAGNKILTGTNRCSSSPRRITKHCATSRYQWKRIARAYDTTGKEVSYTYDDHGRLVGSAGNDGIVRQYEYDERNNLVGIREPDRIVRNCSTPYPPR